MDDAYVKTFVAIFLLETITGVSSSIFIILSLAGHRRTNITPFNMILISLNVSNVFYTIIMSAYLFISSLWSYLLTIRSVFYFFASMSLYTITCSSWLTAILCFFYFMKIVPSRPGILMDIKNKIGAIVWKLILMVEVFSLGGSFLSMLISLPNSNERNLTMNDVETMEENIKQQTKLTKIILILNSWPFLLIILMTVASAWFLKVYDSQMKKNNGTLANTNVKDYRKAVQTMTGFLIFYLFVFFAVVNFALEIFIRSVGFWICAIPVLLFPTGQSTLLIYSNQNLKQTLKELVMSLTCRNSGN